MTAARAIWETQVAASLRVGNFLQAVVSESHSRGTKHRDMNNSQEFYGKKIVGKKISRIGIA